MQRLHVLGLLVALILVGALLWFLLPGGGEPPPPPPGGADPAAQATPALAANEEPSADLAGDDATRREAAVLLAPADPRLDPEIRAALSGFRGRVVDHAMKPVADCGVRIYRGALDSIVPLEQDLTAETASYEPRYIAGETRTGDDGRFLIDGVWPKGFYLLFAGIGTDAPSHRVLPHSPGPGEIVDLGDIALNHAAVVTGTVVDEDGLPVADALVRGVDLPGQLLGFFPVERFDPEGAVLVREPNAPIQVIEMPPWVKSAFEHLPIPTTRTGPDGTFRLAGLVPGNNVIATTKRGFLADLRTSVMLKPGQVRALGTIRLRLGEELIGKVVDTAGKPVAGAEVLAGTTVLVAPVDLAMRVGRSDAEGRFHAEGFGAGRVTVAARRGAKDPWVLAEPQPILGEVVVTLPAVASLTVRVTDAAGAVVREPRVEVLPGVREQEIGVMRIMGMVQAIDVRSRREVLDDGRIRIKDLPNGRYVVVVASPDTASAAVAADLRQGDAEVAVTLPARNEFAVRVLSPEGRPVRSAAVYAQERGAGRTREMPFLSGRTDSAGRITVKQAASQELRVSAEHPRYGTVNGECKLGGPELLLQYAEPGWIEGTLTEYGKPPAPGKYTVVVQGRPAVRGAMDQVPMLVTPGLDGRFLVRALQPGVYRLSAANSFEVLTSPGGVMSFAQSMYFANDMPNERVEVAAGLGAQATLAIGEEVKTGPTGRVHGSAMVDGRLAAGFAVLALTDKGRRTTRVDAAGRFELADVPVGRVQLSLIDSGDMMMFTRQGLASQSFELKEGEQREVVFDLQTTSIAGIVTMPDGAPATGVNVAGGGRPLDATSQGGEEARISAVTDANGAFRIEQVPHGVYWLEVRGRGQGAMRGRIDGVRADSSGPVTGLQLQLRQMPVVSGRIDVTVFATRPEWSWMTFHRDDDKRSDRFGTQVGGTGVDREGRFSTSDLEPGTYRARVHANLGNEWKRYDTIDPIVVPPGGLSNVLLRLLPAAR